MVNLKKVDKNLLELYLPEKPTDEVLALIFSYLIDGLSEEEACVLADYPYVDFKTLKQHVPAFSKAIEKKKVEFKHNHLKTLSARSDPKTSQWLLEKLRSDEFGSKRQTDTNLHVDVVHQIIKNIQQNNNESAVKIYEADTSETPDQGSEAGVESVLN